MSEPLFNVELTEFQKTLQSLPVSGFDFRRAVSSFSLGALPALPSAAVAAAAMGVSFVNLVRHMQEAELEGRLKKSVASTKFVAGDLAKMPPIAMIHSKSVGSWYWYTDETITSDYDSIWNKVFGDKTNVCSGTVSSGCDEDEDDEWMLDPHIWIDKKMQAIAHLNVMKFVEVAKTPNHDMADYSWFPKSNYYNCRSSLGLIKAL